MKECKDLTEEDVSKLNEIVSSGGSCSLVRCNYCPIAYCDWIASTSKVSVKTIVQIKELLKDYIEMKRVERENKLERIING